MKNSLPIFSTLVSSGGVRKRDTRGFTWDTSHLKCIEEKAMLLSVILKALQGIFYRILTFVTLFMLFAFRKIWRTRKSMLWFYSKTNAAAVKCDCKLWQFSENNKTGIEKMEIESVDRKEKKDTSAATFSHTCTFSDRRGESCTNVKMKF